MHKGSEVQRFRVTGYGLLVTGCGLRVAGYGLRVTGYGLLVAGCRIGDRRSEGGKVRWV